MAPRLVAFVVFLASANALTLQKHSEGSLLQQKQKLESNKTSTAAYVARVLAQSESLGRVLAKAAHDPSIHPHTVSFLNSLRPCAVCKEHRRYGEHGDGGYVMCEDQLKDAKLSAAYSYGVNGFDGWGNDISSTFSIPVHEYDCTNNKQPVPCDTCELHFHNQCLKARVGECAVGGVCKTFEDHLIENGHKDVADGSLILKMDIESSEWAVFANEPPETLKKAKQIVVEFHWLSQTSKHGFYTKAMQHILDAGFAVEHLHANNFAGLAKFGSTGQYQVPDVLEVVLVRKTDSEARATCATDMERLPEDEQNNRNVAEILEGHLVDQSTKPPLLQQAVEYH